jgi:hypothetical protein
MYDVRLKTPFTYIAAGASQSGKTTHVFNILRSRQQILDAWPRNIIYYYSQWQPSFSEFEKEKIVTEWIQALPTVEDIKDKSLPYTNKGGTIVVIDDFMQQLNQETADLFTIISHSCNVNVFLLTQNLFSKNPVFRTLSLNSKYIAIFKNPRDSSQIVRFASQFSPKNTGYIIDAYKASTRKAYSYLLFDHDQSTPDILRVRSDILPSEFPMKVWSEKNCTVT